ncbi:MAG: ABC transporter permease [Propioniciclava sp.]
MAQPGSPVRARVRLLAPWLLGLLLLLAWLVSAQFFLGPVALFPGPGAVATKLVSSLMNPQWWPYLTMTAVEAIGGCLLGVVIAIPLGIAIHRSRTLAAALAPYLGATQAIPAIALAPLLVLWVGYGLEAVIVLCAVLVFFPILVSSVVGLSAVDPDLVDAARLDGASALSLLIHVEFPLALPSVLAGVRNGFTLSVTGAIVGEMVMGGRGLGQLLTLQRDAVDTAGMVATIVVLCVLASGLYGLILLLERNVGRDTVGVAPGQKGTQ